MASFDNNTPIDKDLHTHARTAYSHIFAYSNVFDCRVLLTKQYIFFASDKLLIPLTAQTIDERKNDKISKKIVFAEP